MAIRINGFPQMPRIDSLANPAGAASAVDAAKEFGRFLTEAMGKVEAAQHEAAAASQRLATGEIRDVAEVMIASEKATLALQLTVQVRNKVLEAYQEIMRMQV